MKSFGEIIEAAIIENPVVIFIEGSCIICQNTRDNVFDAAHTVAAFDGALVIDFDDCHNADHIRQYLHSKTGGRGSPYVFIDGIFVGGALEIDDKHLDGSLSSLIAAAYEI